MTRTKPDILLIMTDQQRFDTLSCYGCEAVATPNLDRLAAGGLRFERVYVNNPICTPSRASLMTGRHVLDHGVERLYDDLPDDAVLLPVRLRELGYETSLIGKLHVCSRQTEARRRHPHDGFDRYEWCLDPAIELDSPFNAYASWLEGRCPETRRRLAERGKAAGAVPHECHFSRWAADRAIATLQAKSDRPRFVMMSLFDPHDPFDDTPRAYLERVDLDRMPRPASRGDAAATPMMRAIAERTGGWLNPDADEATIAQARRGYFASVALLDDEIGRVLNALDASGRADDTLVAFVSDHGDMLGDQGFTTKGGFLFDPCVRVPMLLRWPGRVPVGVSRRLAQPHDLAATCLVAAGADPDDLARWMPDSRVLLNAEPEAGEDDFAVCYYPNSSLARPEGRGSSTEPYFSPPLQAVMLRRGACKLIRYRLADQDPPEQWHLFDLELDPAEQTNRWANPGFAATASALRRELEGWLARHRSPRQEVFA